MGPSSLGTPRAPPLPRTPSTLPVFSAAMRAPARAGTSSPRAAGASALGPASLPVDSCVLRGANEGSKGVSRGSGLPSLSLVLSARLEEGDLHLSYGHQSERWGPGWKHIPQYAEHYTEAIVKRFTRTTVEPYAYDTL